MRRVTRAELLAYCLAKPGAWLDQPWEDDAVTKVGSKIFAFLGSGDGAATIGLKCGAGRDEADEWLARYPDDEIREAVDASYDYVVTKLPKRERPSGD